MKKEKYNFQEKFNTRKLETKRIKIPRKIQKNTLQKEKEKKLQEY